MSILQHIMVDIESFGTKYGRVIVSIGAIKFTVLDDNEPSVNSDTFYQTIDIQSSLDVGLTIDGATIRWWFEQGEAAQKALFIPQPRHIRNVLDDFSAWCKSGDRIWAHGSTFDITLLSAAYDKISRKYAWGWRDVRDTRTLFDLAPAVYSNSKEKTENIILPLHNALGDAIRQAIWVREGYKILLGSKNG